MPAEDDKWWLVEKDGKMTNGTSEDEKDSDEDKKDGIIHCCLNIFLKLFSFG